MARVTTGLESLIAIPPRWLSGRRLGLLCNPASVGRDFTHARDLLRQRFPGQLKALYAPQHGFHAEKQDNMIESADGVDTLTGLPVFSLYGATRIPDREMLAPIDVLLIDLQDVGTRVYTFASTIAYCMEAARRYGRKVLVLDRPNPVGGAAVEGNCLDPAWASFVGRFPIPMRHGLTVGELARLFNQAFCIGCDLEIMPMQSWRRDMYFEDTGLPWIAPSPNLPTPVSALVYPGQVIWEGTNVSEGRGTTQPFEMFGAPYLDTRRILAALGGHDLPGVHLRPLVFEPTSNKWAGRACSGFQLHVTDRHAYRPYETGLRLLQAVIACHPDRFEWKQTPYEYEFERKAIDLIVGDRGLRRRVANGEPLDEVVRSWQPGLEKFRERSRGVQLYK
jgi:uncharacterized protein YbbC (DUF1343 family)